MRFIITRTYRSKDGDYLAATNLGNVAVVPRGAWSSGTAYAKNSMVGNEGSMYLAMKDVPAGTLTSDTEYWMLSATRGLDGDVTTAAMTAAIESASSDLQEQITDVYSDIEVLGQRVADVETEVTPLERGGTFATTAAQARTNLGITPPNIGASPSDHTHTISDLSSGMFRSTTNGAAVGGNPTGTADDQKFESFLPAHFLDGLFTSGRPVGVLEDSAPGSYFGTFVFRLGQIMIQFGITDALSVSGENAFADYAINYAQPFKTGTDPKVLLGKYYITANIANVMNSDVILAYPHDNTKFTARACSSSSGEKTPRATWLAVGYAPD